MEKRKVPSEILLNGKLKNMTIRWFSVPWPGGRIVPQVTQLSDWGNFESLNENEELL